MKEIRIAVFSDTHGKKEVLYRAAVQAGEVDYIFFLGDGANDIEVVKGRAQILAVSGNCDFSCRYPKERTEEIRGLKFLALHGHTVNVKMTMDRLFYKAKEEGANYVLFGHTHLPGIWKLEGMTFINPGSLGQPPYGKNPTFALIKIAQDVSERLIQVK